MTSTANGSLDREGASRSRQRIVPENHWNLRGRPAGSVSQGWRVGDLVFVGGQVALDDEGQVIGPGDIGTQTRAVYLAIERVLRAAGAELADVVKVNTYLVTEPDGPIHDEFWAAMAAARQEFFPHDGPCGTGVIVAGLIYPELVIEVDCVAVIRQERTSR